MTPTSAPGGNRRAGFTLVEMLATTAVIGLAAAAVVLTLPDFEPSLSDEAARLAARLERAREEAILTNRATAVEIDGRGYAFSRYDGEGWAPLEEGPFRSETWAEDTRLDGSPARALFDPTGVADPARIVLRRGGASAVVVLDETGEATVDG